MELDDLDREQIAEAVKKGFTSGIIDSQDDVGKSTRINWELKADKWINN